MRVTRPVLGRSPMPKKAVRTSSWRRLELVQLCAFACNRTLPCALSCSQMRRVCRMCVLTFPCCPIAGGGVRCRLRADSVASTCCNMVWRGRKGRVAHTRSARSRVTERSPSTVPHWGGLGHRDIESIGCLGHSLGMARSMCIVAAACRHADIAVNC